MSGVFLGVFAESELPDELARDVTVSRAGGYPHVIPNTWLHEHYPRCHQCGKEMVFVAQIFSDYDPNTYRFLHVFVCPSTACCRQGKGWRCFRTMKPVTSANSSNASRPVTVEKFNFMATTEKPAGADAFDLSDLANALDGVELSGGSLFGTEIRGGGGGGSSSSSPSADRSCNVLGVPVKPKEETTITLTPAYQLYVVPEPAKWETSMTKEKELYQAYLDSGNPDPTSTAVVKESHGAVIADDDFAGLDEDERSVNFMKFRERLDRLPGQVLRYDYNGSPLWAGKFAEEELGKKATPRRVSPCSACGAPRVFECELLPSLFYLSGWFDGHENEMEWGIAAMYTCSEDCHGSGGLSFNPAVSMYEEFVLVEPPEGDSSSKRPDKVTKKAA